MEIRGVPDCGSSRAEGPVSSARARASGFVDGDGGERFPARARIYSSVISVHGSGFQPGF